MSNLQDLIKTLPQVGEVTWIGIRPAKKADLLIEKEVDLDSMNGLIGDHYSGKSRKRQVTLIQEEHLNAVASMLGKASISPEWTRRNMVVKGINLLALRDRQFKIGTEVVLESTGLCHPCSRMEQNLGPGGYNAMRGHGGLTAKVIRGGRIKVGDKVQLISKK